MERLKELYETLAAPGQAKLWEEARKTKIPVTKEQVNNFVQRQGERQVFARLPKATGKTASEGVDARYQLDVVNVREFICLFLVNVFTRKTWAKIIENKSADAVLSAARVLIERLETKPKVVSTDDGGEYTALGTWLLEKAIAHKTHVSDRDVNSIALLDRCVQDIKQRLSRILARTGKGDEKIKLTQAIQAHNNSINATIHGTPNEVGKNPDLVFMNLVDNAAKFQHNKNMIMANLP